MLDELTSADFGLCLFSILFYLFIIFYFSTLFCYFLFIYLFILFYVFTCLVLENYIEMLRLYLERSQYCLQGRKIAHLMENE